MSEPKVVKPPLDTPIATGKRNMSHARSQNCPTHELEILPSLNSIPKELGKHQMRASEIQNIRTGVQAETSDSQT